MKDHLYLLYYLDLGQVLFEKPLLYAILIFCGWNCFLIEWKSQVFHLYNPIDESNTNESDQRIFIFRRYW